MKVGRAFQITVPGSTANLGPGFDSLGLAINRYLTLAVEPSTEWSFKPLSKELQGTPTDKENLIYKTAYKVASSMGKELPPCSVSVTSDIPLARGLGSSAAAIVAAIELADQLCDLGLSTQDKLEMASKFEGHPDNVGASVLGGLVVGSHRDTGTDVLSISNIDMDIVVAIPRFELMTKEARNVLPEQLSHRQAVEASAVSNVLLAALLSKNWELAGKMMDLDLFHQPYRKKLIPEIEEISIAAKRSGAFGVALSGAGPTVICFAEMGEGRRVMENVAPLFGHLSVEQLRIDRVGSTVTTLALNEGTSK